jgi:hypothetical protein
MPEGVVIRHIPRPTTSAAAGAEPEPEGAGNPGCDLEVFVTTIESPEFGKTVTVTPQTPGIPRYYDGESGAGMGWREGQSLTGKRLRAGLVKAGGGGLVLRELIIGL